MSAPVDPTVLLLRSFCLGTMAAQHEAVMRRAEEEGWSHRQVLRLLCEAEAVERAQKRTARLLAESGLPETKTLSTLDLVHHALILEFDGGSLRAKKTPEKAEKSAAP